MEKKGKGGRGRERKMERKGGRKKKKERLRKTGKRRGRANRNKREWNNREGDEKNEGKI